jgi:glycylpeptide N-tetradecanoyltransferase
MTKKDVPFVHKMLNTKLGQHKLRMIFSLEEVEYYFIPREGVINSYIIEDDQ